MGVPDGSLDPSSKFSQYMNQHKGAEVKKLLLRPRSTKSGAKGIWSRPQSAAASAMPSTKYSAAASSNQGRVQPQKREAELR